MSASTESILFSSACVVNSSNCKCRERGLESDNSKHCSPRCYEQTRNAAEGQPTGHTQPPVNARFVSPAPRALAKPEPRESRWTIRGTLPGKGAPAGRISHTTRLAVRERLTHIRVLTLCVDHLASRAGRTRRTFVDNGSPHEPSLGRRVSHRRRNARRLHHGRARSHAAGELSAQRRTVGQ